MNVVLAMFKSDGSRRDFPVKKDRVILGRARGCDLRIPLSSVSRQHCEIRIDQNRLLLRDLGSSNGTFCNHSRVQESALKAGDEVNVGPVSFRVIIDGKPEELAQSAPSPDLDSQATSTDAVAMDESAAPAASPEPAADDALPVIEEAVTVSDDDEAPVLPDDSIAESAPASPEAKPAEDEAVTVDEVVEVIEEVEEAPPARAESPVQAETPESMPPEEPVLEESAYEEPVVEEPVAEEPVAQEPEVQEEELPEFVDEAEPSAPTVDIDDPIAALEAMAASEAVEAEGFPLADEEEEKPAAKPKPQPKPLPKKK